MNQQQHFIFAPFQAGRYVSYIIDKMFPEKSANVACRNLWMHQLTYDLVVENESQSCI